MISLHCSAIHWIIVLYLLKYYILGVLNLMTKSPSPVFVYLPRIFLFFSYHSVCRWKPLPQGQHNFHQRPDQILGRPFINFALYWMDRGGVGFKSLEPHEKILTLYEHSWCQDSGWFVRVSVLLSNPPPPTLPTSLWSPLCFGNEARMFLQHILL